MKNPFHFLCFPSKSSGWILLYLLLAMGCQRNEEQNLYWSPSTISLIDSLTGNEVYVNGFFEHQTFPMPQPILQQSIKTEMFTVKADNTLKITPAYRKLTKVPDTCSPGSSGFERPITIVAEPAVTRIYPASFVQAKNPVMKTENPFSFAFYGRPQGLAYDDISSLDFDNNGNLWLGTYGAGVVRFDGKYFYTYDTDNGFPDNFALRLITDSRGRIVVGTRIEGIVIYDGKNIITYNQSNGFPVGRVEAIHEDKAGNLWVGTYDGGVVKIATDSLIIYDTRNGLPGNIVFDIAEDIEGNLWFATRGQGVSKFNGSSFVNYSVRHGLPDDFITCIETDLDGNIWIGTDQNGLFVFDGKGFRKISAEQGLPDNDITSIFKDTEGGIWIDTRKGGIVMFDGTDFLSYRDTHGIVNNFITSFAQDRSRKIWFGTYGGGVGNFAGNIFRHFTEHEGFPQTFIRAIAEHPNGDLWFGTNTEGVLIRKPDGEFLQIHSGNGLPDDRIRNLYRDPGGNMWIGAMNGGPVTYTGAGLQKYPDDEFLSELAVFSTLHQNNGKLWLAAYGKGLLLIENNVVKLFDRSTGLSDVNVRKVIEDADGNIWVATRDGGVNFFDGEKFIQYTRSSGLPTNDIFDIILDSSGNLWIGTNGSGVLVLNKNKKLFQLTEKHGLGSNFVYTIIEDSDENIWLGTRWGVSLYLGDKHLFESGNDNLMVKLERTAGQLFCNFGREAGFLGIGVNSRSMLETMNGDIWIGANDVLTHFTPRNIFWDTIPPKVQIQSVGLFNESIPWSMLQSNQDSIVLLSNGVKLESYSFDSVTSWHGIPVNLKLHYRNNYLSLSFSAVSSSLSDDLLYQYFLDGQDQYWSPLSQRTEIQYGNLKSGWYNFKVRAMNDFGVVSEVVEFGFKISYPWWLTWWAFAIYFSLLLLIFVSVGLQIKRLRKLREKRRQDEIFMQQQVEVAKKSVEFKQNFLANMSHEIRTPLTGILGMADMLMKTSLDETQEDYLKTLIHSGENLREIINLVLDYSKIEAGKVKLNEELFSVTKLLDEAEKMFFSICRKPIVFKKHVDPDVPEFIQCDYNKVFQIISNLISNAVKFTEKGEVKVSVFFEKDDSTAPEISRIKITVSDSGPGIPEESRDGLFKPFYQVDQAYDRPFEGTGLGLSICKELSKILGGNIGLESEPARGSTFWFTFRVSILKSREESSGNKAEPRVPVTKQLRILLVEDKAVNQKVIGLMLKSLKHQVTIAVNGKSALDIYKPELFDLILMDIQMPVMDGITATQKLKTEYQALPPIVGLSANAFEGDREKYISAGMDEYLTKPFKEADFIELIEKLNL